MNTALVSKIAIISIDKQINKTSNQSVNIDELLLKLLYKKSYYSMHGKERHFKESTNFSFSVSLLNVLADDGKKLGYIKNKHVNISGFLNSLILALSHYREDLHSKFLEYNHGDENIAKLVERNIFNVYLTTLDLNDDGTMNVPFRVSRDNKKEYMHIHDVLLAKYEMSFTSYVRTLLNDYCSKKASDRELFYYYDSLQSIKECIADKRECNFYLKDGKMEAIIPVFVDIYKDANYICGLSTQDLHLVCLLLSNIDKDIELDRTRENEAFDYDGIYKEFLALMKKECKQ